MELGGVWVLLNMLFDCTLTEKTTVKMCVQATFEIKHTEQEYAVYYTQTNFNLPQLI